MEGKNLWDPTPYQESHFIAADGTESTNPSVDTWGNIYVPAGTNMAVSATPGTSTSTVIRLHAFTLNGVWKEQVATLTLSNGNYGSTTFTTPNEPILLRWCGAKSLASYQLERGSTSTAYEPYQSQEYKINLGKNLFDISKVITSAQVINNNDGTLTINTPAGSSTASGSVPNKLSDYCPDLKVGDVATLSFTTTGTEKYIYLYGTGANFLWSSAVGNRTKTITQAMLDAQVLWYASGTSTTATISNIQIELGDTPTEYAPYFEPIELCKIGDYQDYIYKNGDDWYLHKECGHIQLDANIYGILQDGTAGVNEISYAGAFYVLKGSWNTAGGDYDNDAANARISSNFGEYKEQTISGNGAANSMVDGTFCQRSTNDRVYMRFSTLAGKTGNEVKSMLQEQGGTNFYYYLNTPSNTQITDSTLIGQLDALADADTYDGKTYIKIVANDPNLPALLKVEAYKY